MGGASYTFRRGVGTTGGVVGGGVLVMKTDRRSRLLAVQRGGVI